MNSNKCTWLYQKDEDCGYWETDCGQAFVLLEGTPDENNYHYCPNCGKLLKQVIPEEVGEVDDDNES